MSDKKGAWTFQELDRLRRMYPRTREEVVARVLRRSVESVQRKAGEVFGGRVRRGEWTDSETRMLRQGYGVLTWRGLSLVLGRGVRDIQARVRQLRQELRHGPWDDSEIRFLKQHHGQRKDRDIVVCLSRPLDEIRAQAQQLALAKDKACLPTGAMPRWTAAELALLRAGYPNSDTIELARRLSRSTASVTNKASQMGLRKDPAHLRQVAAGNVAVRYRRGS